MNSKNPSRNEKQDIKQLRKEILKRAAEAYKIPLRILEAPYKENKESKDE
jgi:hypothetical protein